MVKSTEDMIKVEYRCKHCGKLQFKIFKKCIDKVDKRVIIEVRCNRCSTDNTIKL